MPEGEVPPDDGALPGSVRAGAGGRDLGVYVHIPFCAVRCGYCDFTTYTATELGGGATQAAYAATAEREVDIAAGVLSGAGLPPRPVATVFFGGGTPTLLPAADLLRLLGAVGRAWGLVAGAEVTTEANPDSVTRDSLRALADGGFTRVSFGVQSAVPHVLATLDRTHDPARVPDAVGWAREAGLAVSLDLIYGTPGESLRDWARSLDAALDLGPDHVSAYALTVESGTRMGALVRRGALAPPDPDDQAAKYEMADDALSAAGYAWYEVSNWARTPADRCRHNLGYWRGHDWWGIGPGAHSHVGGVRWWNVTHPRPYAERLAAGRTPAAGREVLSAEDVALERILLGVRLAEGLDVGLDAAALRALPPLVADGLVDDGAAQAGRVVLTRRGRLLADAVVRALTG